MVRSLDLRRAADKANPVMKRCNATRRRKGHVRRSRVHTPLECHHPDVAR